MSQSALEETRGLEPKYPVHSKPVLTSLHQTLMIWRTKKALGDGATVAEIGREAGLASTKLWGAGDATTTALTANTVYRALSDADELIRNVGEGRFPDKRTTAEQEREAEAAIVATAATMAAATGVGATPLG